MSAKISIHHNSGIFDFTMTDANGEVLLQSIDFYSLPHCREAIALVLQIGPYSHNYEKLSLPTGQHYFVIKDTSGNIIAKSQMFWSVTSRDYSLKFVVRECMDVRVIH